MPREDGQMYALIYFDTEDFISPPNSPAHTLPGQLAEIMHKHGLQGCFHIHGEKARFLERHKIAGALDTLRKHDVSLHYDRGSIHPTTAEEVSELDWFRGVERTLFRELPGFQALERIFGRCSALTQHGGTFAAQIVYAAGKLGKPFFYSPFRLPGRNVVWFCNNLLIGGYQANFYFDQFYRDTPKFEASLAKVSHYLDERAKAYDFTAMFGCHPVITIMEKFPDVLNFKHGATPAPKDWIAPTMVKGVSIPLILKNFERLVVRLVNHPRTQWTTVEGIHKLYGARPARVPESEVLKGAEQVVQHGGPIYTSALSAGEIFFLLARRAIEPLESYEVPQVMGPTEVATQATLLPTAADVQALAAQLMQAVMSTGYLPPVLGAAGEEVSLESALLLLACHATGQPPRPTEREQVAIEAMPGVSEAIKNVKQYKAWSIHGPRYNSEEILKHFRLQCWTLKPALTEREYGMKIELGRHLNPMFERK